MEKTEKTREKLGSRLGFILLSAGCAIGCGNVWKFPYLCGENGGAAFLILYLVFLVIMGLPIMTMEFSLGRASKKSPLKMYKAIGKEKWSFHGKMSLVGNIALMMFYTVVTAWIIRYFIGYVDGSIFELGTDSATVAASFTEMEVDTKGMIIATFGVIIAGFLICSFKISSVLEKVEKYMMLLLLILMVVLAIRGITLDNASEGLKFYLVPDFSKITIQVVMAAMNQAFFTLSLGIGSMAIFGSYIDDSRSLMGESVRVVALDTFVAVTAGLIIFPACFTYNGGETGAGPGLIFTTLPMVFNSMGASGRIWGAIFFLFFAFAALSTVLAVFENIVAMVMDAFNLKRKKSAIICMAGMLLLCLPCILGFTSWTGFQLYQQEAGSINSGFFDLEDFIVSNLCLPIGSLIMCVFCSHKFGWGWDNFRKEANKGVGMKVPNGIGFYCRWILPLICLTILIWGLIDLIPNMTFFG